MFILYFIYGLILGIFLYAIFESNLGSVIFYILLFEILYFIFQKKFRIEYNPFVRFFYILSLLVGYFSSYILYGNVNHYDPNIPNYF